MAVPKEYHGHIIGQKGHDVRKLMEEFDVNILVPPSAESTDVLKISGSPSNIELAKQAISERVKQLDEDKVERVCVAVLCLYLSCGCMGGIGCAKSLLTTVGFTGS